MSVTTTQNPATYSIIRTLADYEVHHSETPDGGETGAVEAPNARTTPAGTQAQNDSGREWEARYRRVPAYRPVDPNLDFASRNVTLNGAERFFIYNMFGGISMVEGLNRLWRATGGKINDTYFRWPVGGEY